MGAIKEIGIELIGLGKYFIVDEDQHLEANPACEAWILLFIKGGVSNSLIECLMAIYTNYTM